MLKTSLKQKSQAMHLSKFIQYLVPLSVSGAFEPEIKNVTLDSRKVIHGSLFVAICGFKEDGARFVEQAIQKGAVAVISENHRDDKGIVNLHVADARIAFARAARLFYQHADRKLSLIGVTGTNGKSTTVYLIQAILKEAALKTGRISTNEYDLGGKILPAVRTTPEADELQQLFQQMSCFGCTHAVVETSSHALNLRRLHDLKFMHACFTNFSHEHLDFHGTMQAYFEAKCRLFDLLTDDGCIAVNIDDAAGGQIAVKYAKRSLTFSLEERSADLYAIPQLDNATLALASYQGKQYVLQSNLMGRHNLYNILAASAVCLSMGIPFEKIATGVKSFAGVPGRMQRIGNNGSFELFIDFAHTPEALKVTLRAAREICRRKIFLVFGCGGERDKSKRPLMGAAAEKYADFSFITSDNSRLESAEVIQQEIDAGFASRKSRVIIPNRRSAIAAAIHLAKEGDLVLVAGRGHETHMGIGAEIIPFDDGAVCREILREAKLAAA